MISHNIAALTLESAHRFPSLARDVAMFDRLVLEDVRHNVGLDSCQAKGWDFDRV